MFTLLQGRLWWPNINYLQDRNIDFSDIIVYGLEEILWEAYEQLPTFYIANLRTLVARRPLIGK